jgi:hypothetical protein
MLQHRRQNQSQAAYSSSHGHTKVMQASLPEYHHPRLQDNQQQKRHTTSVPLHKPSI